MFLWLKINNNNNDDVKPHDYLISLFIKHHTLVTFSLMLIENSVDIMKVDIVESLNPFVT